MIQPNPIRSHVESTSQNLLAGPTLSMPQHRMQNDGIRLYQSPLIQNPNRKLNVQCHRTEMEVIMKESSVKGKKKGPPPLIFVTCCQMVICAVVSEGSSDNTRLSNTAASGRQREMFRRLK